MAQPKTALITGSTSGIGLAIATAFARAGYHIVLNGLDATGPETAQQLEREFGVKAIYSPANLLHNEEMDEMIAQAMSTFGGIDVLINNAGIQHVSPVEDFPVEKWNAILSIVLTGAFYLTRAVWPSMKKNRFGRVINLVSAHGLVASPYKSAYVAAKHGLIGFTKTIALEGAAFGITANAICPGYALTPIVEKQIPDQMRVNQMSREEVIQQVLLKEHAIKDFVALDSIAQTALFLADSPASASITGISLPIDCGWTAH